MSLVKSRGNMYDWVTHMHTHLGGQCPHKCSYCYVQTGPARMGSKYKGSINLMPKELAVNYGSDRTIFIEHMNDMFAAGVKEDWIARILEHTRQYPSNTYIFQTKNTEHAWLWSHSFPGDFMIGTTVETNRDISTISLAPAPQKRVDGLMRFKLSGHKVFVTIEPILVLDPKIMARWIIEIRPEFVNIGADSKGTGLQEPPAEQVQELIERLRLANVTIRKKTNLERILP